MKWSEALALGQPEMDATHREFVELLNRCEACGDADLPAAWAEFIAHTKAHFGHEDAQMEALTMPSAHCHQVQHKVVLQAMREGAAQAASGDVSGVRMMIPELADWFARHVQVFDAALALHLRAAVI
jgi:hemerythrin-like metal-binding protein